MAQGMKLKGSLQRKLILSISGVLIVLLAGFGLVITQTISDLTRQKTEAQVAELIKLKAEEIKGFFVERARVPQTVLTDPRITNWLSDYDERGKDLTGDNTYQSITESFEKVVSSDPTIKSIFVGSANTYEYLYDKGRVGVDTSGPDAGDPDKGYFTNKRPWWHQAVKKDGLYLTSPQVDATDKTISSVLQMTLYNENGEFVGVGGVDILITTIADLVDQIEYQGRGKAFLLNEQQQLVYFPTKDIDLELNTQLDDLDSIYSGKQSAKTSGFDQAAEAMSRQNAGEGLELTWKGDDYQLFYVPIYSENPDIDWTLAILVPNQLVEGPIAEARWFSFGTLIAIIIALTIITYVISLKIFKPVKEIARAMENVAHGDGDLTRRLKVESDDEVGAVAREFNRFVDRIQELIAHAYQSSDDVDQSVRRVSATVSDLNNEVLGEQQKIKQIGSSVAELNRTSETINQYAQDATGAANEMSESMQVVSQNSTKTQQVIGDVSTSITSATEAVVNLNEDVAEITSVLEVITSIAEQTNLLALNAAIEAARAGEQGRGFAVVADEVRTLANRTQQSTDHIRSTVEKLQSGATQVREAMQRTDSMSNQGEQQVELVLQAITEINVAVDRMKQMNDSISGASSEQQSLTKSISESLDSVHLLTEQMVSHSGSMEQDFHRLNDISSELKSTVKRFKV